MKIIFLLFFSTTFILAQPDSAIVKSSDKSALLLNIFFQYGNKSFSKSLIKETDISENVQTIFADSSYNSTVHKNHEMFLAGLAGSFGFGIMGAFIGYNTKKKCAGSSDVIQVCSGDGHYARLGASIGGVSGSILGYLSKRKDIKQKVPVLKILMGSIAGGVVGYYLTDVTFGMSAIIFPPVGANILLHL